MTKTRAQLVTRALEKLKVVGAGQTASAGVTQLVDKVVDPVMADLATRNIFAWGDENELPEEAFEHLADIVANATAGDFGKDSSEAVRTAAERRLRQLELYVLSGQAQRVEYF